MPCVVGILGNPPTQWAGADLLPDHLRGWLAAEWKLPGMGYVLGSEFMRNLGWSGFKPDRHVKRLFTRWFPSVIESCTPRAEELQTVVGRRNRDLREFLLFTLVGIRTAPEGVPLSAVDNLLWTLGAYVEKKGRESAIRYWQ